MVKRGEVAMKFIKCILVLFVSLFMSCMTLPNASNVKSPDAEITGCVMPNGTITDLYMFKSLKDGHYYSWYVINNMMDLFENPIKNFSSADRKDFTSLKPVNKQGVFQDKYSSAGLGELANYMQTNGFSCGFWHEIRGGKMIIAEVWTENGRDYMYREVVFPNKIESILKEIETRIAKQQQEQSLVQWKEEILPNGKTWAATVQLARLADRYNAKHPDAPINTIEQRIVNQRLFRTVE